MRELQLLKQISLLSLILLLLFQATRLLFYLMNPTLFAETFFQDELWSFVLGTRFDLSALFMANGLVFLLMVVLDGVAAKFTRPFLALFFAVVNGIFLGANLLDAEFFKFNGKRVTKDYLQNTEDIQRHSLSVFITYWWLFSLFVLSTVLGYFMFKRLTRASHGTLSWPRKLLGAMVVIAVTVVAVRGGLQFKPISLVTAYSQGSQGLGSLVLNTPFAFFKGHSAELGTAPVFVKDLNEALKNIHAFREQGPGESPFLPVPGLKNVVVLVVESLSTEYTGLVDGQPSYTPFVDTMKEKAVVFAQNFANGRRSIEAMPSLFCGLPALVTVPIITSSLSQNELHCLPEFFNKKGFETLFFHGAHNGSFHMDSFSSKAGFKRFVGFDEYPNPADSDGSWGILDEPILQYMALELSKLQKPFFAGAFTLSSHHPYFIPPQLRGKFKKGPLEIHESIGYADYALRRFFETASKQPWFKETLFVITGDHTQKNHEPAYQVFTGNYRVPLIFYSENEEFKRRFLPLKTQLESKITQGVDIPDSVMKLMGETPSPGLPPFGANVFDPAIRGLALNYDGYQYWMKTSSGAVGISHEGEVTHPGADFEILVLKSFVSLFNQGMRQNSIYRIGHPSK